MLLKQKSCGLGIWAHVLSGKVGQGVERCAVNVSGKRSCGPSGAACAAAVV